MNRLTIAITAAVLGAAAGLGGWAAYQHYLAPADESAGADSAEKDREVLYWVAPMDPSYKRDEPGQSPMGMDLVPVYADEAAADPASVVIEPRMVQNLGITVAEARRRDLSRNVRALGRVTYDERKVSHIHTRVKGWVERLHVDAAGDPVEADQPILEIYSPELVTAQEEYLIALRRADGRDAQRVDQARKRLRFYGISDTEIDRLRRTGEPQDTVKLRAPHTGVVTELGVREGMRVTPEDNLYTVADLSTVWVQLDLYAAQLGWVAPGDPVTLELPFGPDRQWQGTIDYVYPFLERATRTVAARVVLDNPDRVLKPDMFATATIQADRRADVLAVPSRAVIRTGEAQAVAVAEGGGRFRMVRVATGITNGHWTQITDGLEAGDRVVTSGQFLIDAESDFDAAAARIGGQPEEEQKQGDHSDMEGMDHSDMDHGDMDPSQMEGEQ